MVNFRKLTCKTDSIVDREFLQENPTNKKDNEEFNLEIEHSSLERELFETQLVDHKFDFKKKQTFIEQKNSKNVQSFESDTKLQTFSLSLPIKTVQSSSQFKKIFVNQSNDVEALLSSNYTSIETETCIIRRTTFNDYFRSPAAKTIFPHDKIAHTPSPIRKAHLNFQAAVEKQQKKIMSQLHTQRRPRRVVKKAIKRPTEVYKKKISFRNFSQALKYQKLIPIGFGYRMPTFLCPISPQVYTVAPSNQLESSPKPNSPLRVSDIKDLTSEMSNVEQDKCFSPIVNHKNQTSLECVSEKLLNKNCPQIYHVNNSKKSAETFLGEDSFLEKTLMVESSSNDSFDSLNNTDYLSIDNVKSTEVISCYICGMSFYDINLHNAHIKDHDKDIDDLWL